MHESGRIYEWGFLHQSRTGHRGSSVSPMKPLGQVQVPLLKHMDQ